MAASPASWLKPLRNNVGLKLLSLLVALVVWHVIRDAISFEVVIPDIRVQILPVEGMAILNQSATSVDVTFRGSQEDIRMLDARQIHCSVDLRGRSGTVSEVLSVEPDMIKGARGVRAVSVNPRRVHVTLDREAEKLVPVLCRVSGQPLSGQVEAVTCEPATVLLRGPQARLKTTEILYTAPIDVEGRVESFTRRAPVLSPGDDWVARITPADVLVRVAVTARGSEASIQAVPVAVLQPLGRSVAVAVEPAVVDVVLSGRSNDVVGITAADVRAFVDAVGLTGTGAQTVAVQVYGVRHSGLSAVASPATVRVTVSEP